MVARTHNQNTLALGCWNVLCDVCGFKFKNVDLLKRWDGLMVCKACWEPRHPQDFIRAIPDMQKVPWTRPEATNQFVADTTLCTIETMSAVPGVGTPGCIVPGFTPDLENPTYPGTFTNTL